MESEIAESNKITQYVVSIIVCAIIIALVLVPLSNIGGTTEVEQPGERMSLAGNIDKNYDLEYENGTPIVISDMFHIVYQDTYVIQGKGVNVSGDSVQIIKQGNEVTVKYLIDDSENEYYATVNWLFVNDPEGSYSATGQAEDINVNEDRENNIYVVGLGQFDTYWTYNDGNTNIVRE